MFENKPDFEKNIFYFLAHVFFIPQRCSIYSKISFEHILLHLFCYNQWGHSVA